MTTDINAPADSLILKETIQAGIVQLTLNRPTYRNALTLPQLTLIEQEIAKLSQDVATRSVIIRGAGDQAFSAGYDIDALSAGMTLGDDGLTEVDRKLDTVFRTIECAPFPVIAQISGFCIGGGMEFAMACDIRIADTSAIFKMPPANLGWVYSAAGFARFIQAMGAARTRHLFLTAAKLDAATAERWGIVGEVLEPNQLITRVQQLASDMATFSPIAQAGTKQAVSGLSAMKLREDTEAWEAHLALRQRAIVSKDLSEARAAFLARRKPVFGGS